MAFHIISSDRCTVKQPSKFFLLPLFSHTIFSFKVLLPPHTPNLTSWRFRLLLVRPQSPICHPLPYHYHSHPLRLTLLYWRRRHHVTWNFGTYVPSYMAKQSEYAFVPIRSQSSWLFSTSLTASAVSDGPLAAAVWPVASHKVLLHSPQADWTDCATSVHWPTYCDVISDDRGDASDVISTVLWPCLSFLSIPRSTVLIRSDVPPKLYPSASVKLPLEICSKFFMLETKFINPTNFVGVTCHLSPVSTLDSDELHQY